MATPDQQELREQFKLLGQTSNMPIHFTGDTINTLVIGEEHWRFSVPEAKLIRWIEPSKVLLEGLTGFVYDPKQAKLLTQPKSWCDPNEQDIIWQALTSDPAIDPTSLLPFKEVSDELGIPIIGCDITLIEMWQKAIVKYGEPEESIMRLLTPGNEIEFLRLTDTRTRVFRDRFIGRYIKKHQGIPTKPTVAIVGHAHAKYMHDAKILDNYCFFELVSSQGLGNVVKL